MAKSWVIWACFCLFNGSSNAIALKSKPCYSALLPYIVLAECPNILMHTVAIKRHLLETHLALVLEVNHKMLRSAFNPGNGSAVVWVSSILLFQAVFRLYSCHDFRLTDPISGSFWAHKQPQSQSSTSPHKATWHRKMETTAKHHRMEVNTEMNKTSLTRTPILY